MKIWYSAALVVSLLLGVQRGDSQWQKVASYNVGITGKMAVHGSALFLYGSQSGYKLYRSTDSGGSWQDISGSAAASFTDIFSFNGKLYGTYLSTIYTSDNLGDSWTPLSSVVVTGNGAVYGFASDGATLYGYTNRKSVFKSTDNGANWQEYLVNNPNNIIMIDFCAVGNRFVAVMNGGGGLAGSWISEDGGVNWELKNPATAAAGVYAYNGTVLGLSFGGGVFRLESASSAWSGSNTGLPNNGTFVIPKSMVSQGGVLYLAYQELLSSQTRVVSSADNGVSWSIIDSAGHPAINPAGSNRTIAVNPTHLFSYYWASSGTAGGVYRTAAVPTSVDESNPSVAREFDLQQNYPNPFNPTTEIRYRLSAQSHVTLKVFDVLGRVVETLVNENKPAGEHAVRFDAHSLGSGAYFYRMETSDGSLTKRMMLVR